VKWKRSTLAALFLGQPEDFLQLVLGNMHLVPDVARDALPLLEDEKVVRVRDLEEQGAGPNGDRIGRGGWSSLDDLGKKKARIGSMPIVGSLAQGQVSGVSGLEDASETNWYLAPETSNLTLLPANHRNLSASKCAEGNRRMAL
jgi:hypothetical protein